MARAGPVEGENLLVAVVMVAEGEGAALPLAAFLALVLVMIVVKVVVWKLVWLL